MDIIFSKSCNLNQNKYYFKHLLVHNIKCITSLVQFKVSRLHPYSKLFETFILNPCNDPELSVKENTVMEP